MGNGDCLSENTLLDLLAGRLTPEERAAAERHIDTCNTCRRLLAFLARPSQRRKALKRPKESSNDVTTIPEKHADDVLVDTHVRPQDAPLSAERLSNSHPMVVWPKGTRIGRYVLFEPIGAGSMGVVYEAYDPELDRKVALKLVRAELWTRGALEDYRARLLREAQALARLSDPNVIAVYDVGTFEQQLFVAMEFAEGLTVSRWLKAEKRTPAEILRVYLRAAQGLAAAHAAGLVHRDFKPDNVIVGSDGRVRVMDFGLARAAGPATLDPNVEPKSDPEQSAYTAVTPSGGTLLQENLTHDGTLVGTPAYMAPEQAREGHADAYSDQFSFCVSVWEGLYGVRPYRSADIAGWHDKKKLTLRETPKGARVPLWLRRVLLRGLRQSPKERWPSMQALIAATRRGRAGTRAALYASVAALAVVLVAFTATWQQKAARERRCAGAAEKLAGIWDAKTRNTARAAFTATGLPYASDAFDKVSTRLDAYVREWTDIYTDACTATRVRADQSEADLALRMGCLEDRRAELASLTVLLTHADAQAVEKSVSAASGLSRLSGCSNLKMLQIRAVPPSDAKLRVAVASLDARIFDVKAMRAAGRFKEALKVAAAIAEDAKTLGYLPALGRAQRWLAVAQYENGDPKGAAATLGEAVYSSEAGGDLVELTDDWLELAYVEGHLLGDAARGTEALRHADALIHRVGGDERLELLLVRDRGLVDLTEGHHAQAIAEFTRALELDRVVDGAESDSYARDLGLLATEQMLVFDDDRALANAVESVRLRKALFGAGHPLVAMAINNLGAVYLKVGDDERAAEQFRAAVAAFEASGQPANTYASLCNLCFVLAESEHGEEAERVCDKGLKVGSATVGLDSPRVYMCKFAAAMAQSALGKHEAALALYKKLDVPSASVGNRMRAEGGMGTELVALRRYDEAVRTLQGAEALMRQVENADDDRADLEFQLARALDGEGKEPDRAAKLARESLEQYRKLKGPRAERLARKVESWLAAKRLAQK